MSEHTPGPWKLRYGDVWRKVDKGYQNHANLIAKVSLAGKDSDTFHANGELLAQAWTIPALRGHLEQALRQWLMYAEFEEIDLTDERSPEAEMYRAAKSALKLGQDNG